MARERFAQNALAQETHRFRLVDRLLQDCRRFRVLAANEQVALLRADRIGAQRHAFQQQMRARLHQDPILERAWLALVRVTDHVARLPRRAPREAPFAPGGERGPTAPNQPRLFNCLDDTFRRHLVQGVAERSVIAILGERLGAVGLRSLQKDFLHPANCCRSWFMTMRKQIAWAAHGRT